MAQWPDSDDPEQRVVVRLDSGRRLLVPQAALNVQADGSYELRYDVTEVRPPTQSEPPGNPAADGDELVLPVIEETLAVDTEWTETARVRLTKEVHEREEVVDEPLLEETATVERVAVNRIVDEPPPLRHEGDTLIVPLLEEVLVVEKRLMLREELRITRHRSETRRPQRVTLRREDVTIEREGSAAQTTDEAGTDDDAGRE